MLAATRLASRKRDQCFQSLAIIIGRALLERGEPMAGAEFSPIG